MSLRKIRVRDLSAQAIYESVRMVDWQELLGEDYEGWKAYAVEECDEGHQQFVSAPSGNNECDCCEQMFYFEGPAMNYFYGLPRTPKDIEEAAKSISHLPVCLVEMKDCEFGLALTGGGMDLSWEICESYIRLGYLPPFHFVPPSMVGRGESRDDHKIIAACTRTARIVARQARYQVQSLRMLRKQKGER